VATPTQPDGPGQGDLTSLGPTRSSFLEKCFHPGYACGCDQRPRGNIPRTGVRGQAIEEIAARLLHDPRPLDTAGQQCEDGRGTFIRRTIVQQSFQQVAGFTYILELQQTKCLDAGTGVPQVAAAECRYGFSWLLAGIIQEAQDEAIVLPIDPPRVQPAGLLEIPPP
jgi:hypothetical protein